MQEYLQTGETAAGGASAPSEEARAGKRPEGKSFWRTEMRRVVKHRRLIVFLVPAVFFTILFSYIPMLGIVFAFKESINLNQGDILWNVTHGGWTFNNFLDIFYENDEFFPAVANTLIINVIRLAICFPLSILVAVQLSELKSQNAAKVILIILSIPNFLSWVIVIGIWSGVLHPDYGILGRFTGFIMGQNQWFKPLVVFLSAWKGAGWGCILYYSAIVAIDKTYYESATLEGANRLQKIWYLTLPSILPTVALTLVLNIAGMMAVGFEQIYTMMKINPGELLLSQQVLDTYIYDVSITHGEDIPFATALGVFNGIIGLTLMLTGNYITSKTLKRGLW